MYRGPIDAGIETPRAEVGCIGKHGQRTMANRDRPTGRTPVKPGNSMAREEISDRDAGILFLVACLIVWVIGSKIYNVAFGENTRDDDSVALQAPQNRAQRHAPDDEYNPPPLPHDVRPQPPSVAPTMAPAFDAEIVELAFRPYPQFRPPVNRAVANLENAPLARGRLRDANLPRANFRGANLENASFVQANLNGADFRGAYISFTDFAFANLRGAIFENIDFHRTNFSCSDLTGADLRGADLRAAILRTRSNWSGRCNQDAVVTDVLCDQRTRWPVGFPHGSCRQ